jgi:hypothetical protein
MVGTYFSNDSHETESGRLLAKTQPLATHCRIVILVQRQAAVTPSSKIAACWIVVVCNLTSLVLKVRVFSDIFKHRLTKVSHFTRQICYNY